MTVTSYTYNPQYWKNAESETKMKMLLHDYQALSSQKGACLTAHRAQLRHPNKKHEPKLYLHLLCYTRNAFPVTHSSLQFNQTAVH